MYTCICIAALSPAHTSSSGSQEKPYDPAGPDLKIAPLAPSSDCVRLSPGTGGRVHARRCGLRGGPDGAGGGAAAWRPSDRPLRRAFKISSPHGAGAHSGWKKWGFFYRPMTQGACVGWQFQFDDCAPTSSS